MLEDVPGKAEVTAAAKLRRAGLAFHKPQRVQTQGWISRRPLDEFRARPDSRRCQAPENLTGIGLQMVRQRKLLRNSREIMGDRRFWGTRRPSKCLLRRSKRHVAADSARPGSGPAVVRACGEDERRIDAAREVSRGRAQTARAALRRTAAEEASRHRQRSCMMVSEHSRNSRVRDDGDGI